jgi:hypothetical protein
LFTEKETTEDDRASSRASQANTASLCVTCGPQAVCRTTAPPPEPDTAPCPCKAPASTQPDMSPCPCATSTQQAQAASHKPFMSAYQALPIVVEVPCGQAPCGKAPPASTAFQPPCGVCEQDAAYPPPCGVCGQEASYKPPPQQQPCDTCAQEATYQPPPCCGAPPSAFAQPYGQSARDAAVCGNCMSGMGGVRGEARPPPCDVPPCQIQDDDSCTCDPEGIRDDDSGGG